MGVIYSSFRIGCVNNNLRRSSLYLSYFCVSKIQTILFGVHVCSFGDFGVSLDS